MVLLAHRSVHCFTAQVTGGARDPLAEVEAEDCSEPKYQNVHDRILAARQTPPVQSDYRILYEHPDNGQLCILTPAAHWMGLALLGGVLDTIEVHLLNQPKLSEFIEPCPPLTEEQAMEYLLIKDVFAKHPDLLTSRTNRRRYLIVRADQINYDRDFRDALSINQEVRVDG